MRTLIVCLILLCFIESGAAERTDVQLWSTFTVYKQITPLIKSRIGEELKWRHQVSTFFLDRLDVGVDVKAASWLTWGLAYKAVHLHQDDTFRRFNVPYGDIILKWNLKRWVVDARDRFEYWIPPREKRFVRIRQRLRLAPAQPFFKLRAKPYVAEEYFYDLNASGFKLNRIYLGSTFWTGRLMQVEAYYCLQHLSSDAGWWRHTIWGTRLSLNLK